MNNLRDDIRIYGFEPIIGHNAHVLILGTMPSIKSLELQHYYANPRNDFWKLMAEILEQHPGSYEEWKPLLIERGIALWDVLKSCVRYGSADSAIIDAEPNDFRQLIGNYPTIKTIFFNGSKAEQLFRTFAHYDPNLEYHRLPSSSPACAMKSREKMRQWQVISSFLADNQRD